MGQSPTIFPESTGGLNGYHIPRYDSPDPVLKAIEMRFTETELKGAFVVDLEPMIDERGFFARTYCVREFETVGLSAHWAQSSTSFNQKKGTLRGIHYQCAPHEEIKLVRCTAGSLYDVIVDLRPDSTTYCQWVSMELSAKNRKAFYIPKGFGHAFQTLEEDTEILYHMSEFYHPECYKGARWNDPVFSIEWPLEKCILSDRDQMFPDWIK